MSGLYDKESMIKQTGRGMEMYNLINRVRGNTNYQYGVDKINQSLELILNTRIGESLSNPEFGCNLKDVVFDNNTEVTQDLIYLYVKEAIEKWEPRIELVDVVVSDRNWNEEYSIKEDYNFDLTVPVVVNYRIRQTDIFNSVSVMLINK